MWREGGPSKHGNLGDLVEDWGALALVGRMTTSSIQDAWRTTMRDMRIVTAVTENETAVTGNVSGENVTGTVTATESVKEIATVTVVNVIEIVKRNAENTGAGHVRRIVNAIVTGIERDGVTEIVTGTETVIATVTERRSVTETVTAIATAIVAIEKARESKKNRTGSIRLTRTNTLWITITWIWWTSGQD